MGSSICDVNYYKFVPFCVRMFFLKFRDFYSSLPDKKGEVTNSLITSFPNFFKLITPNIACCQKTIGNVTVSIKSETWSLFLFIPFFDKLSENYFKFTFNLFVQYNLLCSIHTFQNRKFLSVLIGSLKLGQVITWMGNQQDTPGATSSWGSCGELFMVILLILLGGDKSLGKVQ